MEIKYVILFYLALNVITFCLYGIDKYKSKHDRWRIREKTLLLWGFFAPFGQIVGMNLFHHKTRKWYFVSSSLLFLSLHIFLFYKLLL